ncbi:MAG: glycerol-3-phosphate dehydrogenase [Thermoleophilaceae bacterium]|nr:glycerol-3-phosphate dehydrogenase [Thermoleophilaceae bacterium]
MIARGQALAALESEQFDVVVVGGGVTGAGVALDASSRGYSVALVERNDFASGTSSRSSKLIHGGLRYLQNFDLGLVREALLERALMVSLAPHLVHPLPLLVPTFEGTRKDRKIGVGLNMYDVMASERFRRGRRARDDAGQEEWSPDRHRTIDGDEAVAMIPALAARKPVDAYLFYDCQTDDARLVLTILGEAERFGTVLANRCEVLSLLEENGKGTGVRVRDSAGGGEFDVRASTVVNATGVWADRLRPGELQEEEDIPRIAPSRGTHVLLSRELLDIGSAGAIVPAPGGRAIFVLPWLGRTLIGTTDRDYEGDLIHVAPDDEDIEYLLAATNDFFGSSVGVGDLTGAYAGVRPLISTGDPKKSVDISRKAELYETSSGMITITGGKLTTWRRMAKLAVDRIVDRDGRESPCRTDEIQLGLPVDVDELPDVPGVDQESREMLSHRYGHAAHGVLDVASTDPALARRITPELPDLLAEVPFSARNEQALSVGDVMLRRTRLGLLDARALAPEGSEGARAVAQALGAELGWDAARVESELADWHQVALAEGLLPAPR